MLSLVTPCWWTAQTYSVWTFCTDCRNRLIIHWLFFFFWGFWSCTARNGTFNRIHWARKCCISWGHSSHHEEFCSVQRKWCVVQVADILSLPSVHQRRDKPWANRLVFHECSPASTIYTCVPVGRSHDRSSHVGRSHDRSTYVTRKHATTRDRAAPVICIMQSGCACGTSHNKSYV